MIADINWNSRVCAVEWYKIPEWQVQWMRKMSFGVREIFFKSINHESL